MKKQHLKTLGFILNSALLSDGYMFGGSIFGDNPFEEPEKYPYERLGQGYELRPIELSEEEAKDSHIVGLQYSHLYHNGLKVSDNIFRRGGTGGTFKDGYCALIHYVREKARQGGFSFGTHVIINHLGEIVLSGTGISSYPYHSGGHVGQLKDTYYDLRTGNPILTASSSGAISSKNLIIIEHKYDWYNKDLPLGVYTINKETCEVLKIDDVKK